MIKYLSRKDATCKKKAESRKQKAVISRQRSKKQEK
jgi:hypothetical protein